MKSWNGRIEGFTLRRNKEKCWRVGNWQFQNQPEIKGSKIITKTFFKTLQSYQHYRHHLNQNLLNIKRFWAKKHEENTRKGNHRNVSKTRHLRINITHKRNYSSKIQHLYHTRYSICSSRFDTKNQHHIHSIFHIKCLPCELVIAIRRSLHGEDVASLAGGLVLEAGL